MQPDRRSRGEGKVNSWERGACGWLLGLRPPILIEFNCRMLACGRSGGAARRGLPQLTRCHLVNWACGVGKCIDINATRAIVAAILEGNITDEDLHEPRTPTSSSVPPSPWRVLRPRCSTPGMPGMTRRLSNTGLQSCVTCMLKTGRNSPKTPSWRGSATSALVAMPSEIIHTAPKVIQTSASRLGMPAYNTHTHAPRHSCPALRASLVL